MPAQAWTESTHYTLVDGTAVGNSTSEALLLPVFSIGANVFKGNGNWRVRFGGRVSNVVTAQPTMTMRMRFGGLTGTVICASSATTCSATVFTNSVWTAEFFMTVRAGGSSGSIFVLGEGTFPNLATGQSILMGSAGSATPAAVTFDVSVDWTLALTFQWSAANASNTIQAHVGYLESLNF